MGWAFWLKKASSALSLGAVELLLSLDRYGDNTDQEAACPCPFRKSYPDVLVM